GSDLLGDMMVQRAVEFELKAQVMKPMEVLLSATKVNAALFRMSDRIGTVEPGKYADLIVEASGAGPDDTVLDVACGPGLVVAAFARVVRHATGIDITP